MFQVDLKIVLMQQINCLVEYIGEAPDSLSGFSLYPFINLFLIPLRKCWPRRC